MLFNLVFTSLPVAVLGIVSSKLSLDLPAARANVSLPKQFDKDVSAETSLNVPQLYRRGILGLEWTRLKFYFFMLDGLYQSFISFFVPYMVYSLATTLSVTGHDFSVWEFGTTVAACAVTSANLFVGLHIRYWTWMVFVIIIASTLAFHVWIAIYSQFEVFTFQNELICELLPLPFAEKLFADLRFRLTQTSTRLLAFGRPFSSPRSPPSVPSELLFSPT